jgi:hypothetical protein
MGFAIFAFPSFDDSLEASRSAGLVFHRLDADRYDVFRGQLP